MLDDSFCGKPIFAAKVGLLEQAFVPCGEKLLAPSLIEGFGEFFVKALEVPVIIAEFGGVHGLAELWEEPPFAKKSLDLGVFVDDAIDFAGIVDGRSFVINTIMDERVGEQHDFLC